MTQETRRTPDWLLERIALGELPPEQLAAAKQQLESEPDGLARLAALQASDQQIQADYPAAQVTAEVERRRERTQQRASKLWLRVALLSPVAAAAVLVLWLAVPGQIPGSDKRDDNALEQTRSKGLAATLIIERLDDGEDERLYDKGSVRGGDVLQLYYIAGEAAHGLVLSIDGRGAVTRHLPRSGRQSAPLQPTGRVQLDAVYELDDAPDFERFFLITASASFDVSEVEAAAQLLARDLQRARSAELKLPRHLLQHSILLQKQTAP